MTKSKGEPIIDQHVLRAFGIYKAEGDSGRVEKLRKMSIINGEQKMIKEYKAWLNSQLTARLREEVEYSYHVDKVLFALGKRVKLK